MIIDLQERLKKLKRALPSQTFSMEKTADHPAARRMVKEALILARAGNFSGAVDTAFTAGYVAACAEIAEELKNMLKEYLLEVYEARHGKKGGGKK
jgi:hypothetical protein